MYMPYDIGCLLVRNEDHLAKAFAVTPAYLEHGEGSLGLNGAEYPWFGIYGVQLSRGFRALKAWMSLKEHGLLKYGRLIQQNIDQLLPACLMQSAGSWSYGPGPLGNASTPDSWFLG
jgi:glutamate/tyrosine decarboxylase-like PLP-dependent enzyme